MNLPMTIGQSKKNQQSRGEPEVKTKSTRTRDTHTSQSNDIRFRVLYHRVEHRVSARIVPITNNELLARQWRRWRWRLHGLPFILGRYNRIRTGRGTYRIHTIKPKLIDSNRIFICIDSPYYSSIQKRREFHANVWPSSSS